MRFQTVDYTPQIVSLIMARQSKTKVEGIEIILPKQGYTMTYKERLKDAKEKANNINTLILS